MKEKKQKKHKRSKTAIVGGEPSMKQGVQNSEREGRLSIKSRERSSDHKNADDIKESESLNLDEIDKYIEKLND